MIALLNDEKIATDEITHVAVETYRIAAEHAAHRLGRLRELAAQLSLSDGGGACASATSSSIISSDAVRRDPAMAQLAREGPCERAARDRSALSAAAAGARDGDDGARQIRRQADEALGSRLVPFDDEPLKGKFHDLVAPVLGANTATKIATGLWTIETVDNVRSLVESTMKRSA